MESMWNQVFGSIGTYIPSLIGALAILVAGWLIAVVVSGIVAKGLRKVRLNDRLYEAAGDVEREKRIDVEKGIGTGLYYVIMLFVLVAFFQTLRVSLITEPINRLLNQVFQFLPQVAGGATLLVIAWVVAKVLKMIVLKGLGAANIDERFGRAEGEEKAAPLSKSIADAVYWLVFLLFLPAVLGALSLEGLLRPVQEMLNKIMGFLPNVATAGILFVIGWLVARIARQIVSNLLSAVGTDTLAERVGMTSFLGKQKLSGIVGLIVYVFILIPIVIAALNALQLEAVTAPASNMLNMILAALPRLFAAVVLLATAYAVGKLVSGLVNTLLAGIGFNGVLARLGLGEEAPAEGQWTPSAIVGSVALLAILFFAALEAARLLEFEVVASLVSQFMVFAGHILAGLVIFAVGLALAKAVFGAITATGTAQAGLLGAASRLAILVLAGAMALRQMGLANEIINIAFGMLLGAIAIAVAIAFGIGGRDIAAAQLEQWVRSLKSKPE